MPKTGFAAYPHRVTVLRNKEAAHGRRWTTIKMQLELKHNISREMAMLKAMFRCRIEHISRAATAVHMLSEATRLVLPPSAECRRMGHIFR